jgi:glutamine amidotransferase
MKPELLAMVQGNTDSEHLATLYIGHLGGDVNAAHSLEEMKLALLATIRDVIAAHKAILTPTQLTNAASSLNLCTSTFSQSHVSQVNDSLALAADGEQLVAIRFRNHSTQQPPSLYMSTTAGVILNRKYEGSSHDTNSTALPADHPDRQKHCKHVIIVSEPTSALLRDLS